MSIVSIAPQKSFSTRAWAEMLFLAMLWGGSFVANRLALNELGVFTTVALRVLGGCTVIWIYIALRRLPLPRDPKIWAALLVMGLLNNVVPFSLIAWGQLSIPSGLAAILNGATAIIGVLVAALALSDERLTGRKLIGVVLGFAGVATAIGIGALRALDLTSLAQLAILGASTCYAVSGVFARVWLRGVAPQVAVAGMLTTSVLIMLPLALWTEGVPSAPQAASVWLGVAYLAVVSTAIAYLMFYRLLELVGAGNTSLVTLLVAPIAIVLGAVILGETLPLRAYVGFGILALGLMVVDGRIGGRFGGRLGEAKKTLAEPVPPV